MLCGGLSFGKQFLLRMRTPQNCGVLGIPTKHTSTKVSVGGWIQTNSQIKTGLQRQIIRGCFTPSATQWDAADTVAALCDSELWLYRNNLRGLHSISSYLQQLWCTWQRVFLRSLFSVIYIYKHYIPKPLSFFHHEFVFHLSNISIVNLICKWHIANYFLQLNLQQFNRFFQRLFV